MKEKMTYARKFLFELLADGTVDAIAEQYGISADALIK